MGAEFEAVECTSCADGYIAPFEKNCAYNYHREPSHVASFSIGLTSRVRVFSVSISLARVLAI
jgi:hypothetical protein